MPFARIAMHCARRPRARRRCRRKRTPKQGKYPDHPVKVVVGFSAGGGTDVAARVIAQKLTEATGQTFVVENRTGASGLIGSEQVARSPADGYTIMVGSQTTLAVAPALYRKFQLDVTKDLTGMAMIGISPLVAVVNANSPIHSIKDLIAEAKAKNGTMNFGSGGVGTTPHMAGELLAYNAGIKWVHVAYRGEAPGINDLLAGQIPFMFSNLSVVLGNIQGGKLRALAVTSTQRVPQLPDVPTVAEIRLSGLRCGDLVCAGRARRHAARRGDEDQRRDEEDHGLGGFAKALRDDRHAARQGSHARRDQRLHQVRDRQMGEGDQGRRREAGGLERGELKFSGAAAYSA